jgi:hypothetical protein
MAHVEVSPTDFHLSEVADPTVGPGYVSCSFQVSSFGVENMGAAETRNSSMNGARRQP